MSAIDDWCRGRLPHPALASLEGLLTHPEGFGLVTATPLQRAICRIVEGRSLAELHDAPGLADALGCPVPECILQPAELLLLAGIRGGKSLLAAALAVRWSQTCDLSGLGAGEVARVSVVSLTKDLSRVVFGHLAGNVQRSPVLRELLVGEPTADGLFLRHPTGALVEVRVAAGARAGASLVARWCAGVCFDEAPRMVGADDGVVNLEHAQTAVRGRLLPGAQMISIGSPWAPYGPAYEQFQANWGRPTHVVAMKAPGPALNPVWWTPERIAALKIKDETAYQTDVLAEFADAEESMFPTALLDACTPAGRTHLEYDDRAEYAAAMDPATRGNAWTLVVTTRTGNTKQVALARQWQGSKLQPLRPGAVLAEIAELLRDYGLDYCVTDQYAGDALVDLAYNVGLTLSVEDWTAKSKAQAFTWLATEMAQGRVELVADMALRKDLQLTKRKVTQSGISVVLPRTPDGRHCDYAPSLAKCVSRWLDDIAYEKPMQGSPEYASFIGQELERQALDEFDEAQNNPWWAQLPR